MDGNSKVVGRDFIDLVICLCLTDTFIGPEQHIFTQSPSAPYIYYHHEISLKAVIISGPCVVLEIYSRNTRLCFKLDFELGHLDDRLALNNDRDENPTMFLSDK